MAFGGSTNAILHLIAIAREVDINLSLDDFDFISRQTPYICRLNPAGPFTLADFDSAGGVSAILHELMPLLHGDATTVSGFTVAQNVVQSVVRRRDVIASLEAPLNADGGLAVLHGNLCPDGAIIKHSAVIVGMQRFQGTRECLIVKLMLWRHS